MRGDLGANNRCKRVPRAEQTKKTNLCAGRAWGQAADGECRCNKGGGARGEARCSLGESESYPEYRTDAGGEFGQCGTIWSMRGVLGKMAPGFHVVGQVTMAQDSPRNLLSGGRLGGALPNSDAISPHLGM